MDPYLERDIFELWVIFNENYRTQREYLDKISIMSIMTRFLVDNALWFFSNLP